MAGGGDTITVSTTLADHRIYLFSEGEGDTLEVDGGQTDIYGGADADTLTATGDGDTYVFGGDGNDILEGGGGAHLFGGAGEDELTATGEGANLYGLTIQNLTDTFDPDGSAAPTGGRQVLVDDGEQDILLAGGLNPILHVGKNDVVNILGPLILYANNGLPSSFGGNGGGYVEGNIIWWGDPSQSNADAIISVLSGGTINGQEVTKFSAYTPSTPASETFDFYVFGDFTSLGAMLFISQFISFDVAQDNFVDLGGGGGAGVSPEMAGGIIVDGTVLDDDITGGTGDETISGYMGDDILHGGDGADLIFGGLRNDTLFGDAGNDILEGGLGDDSLTGGIGNDVLQGGQGDDVLFGDAGADVLDGGDGYYDTANYSQSASAVSINLSTGIHSGGDAAGDTINGIEDLTGSSFDDTLIGDDEDNVLIGGLGADILDGGDGFDFADYSGSAAGVIVNLITNINQGGDAEGDTLSNIEVVVGSNHNDQLYGSLDSDVLEGGLGDDIVDGGAGDDVIYGDLGSDQIDGGSEFDTLIYSINPTAGVTVYLDGLTAGIGGFAEGDVVSNIERVEGTTFDDIMFGTSADEELIGNGGNDDLRGGGGADDIFGGNGDDTLYGQDGNDFIRGDFGIDTVFGGGGDDLVNGGFGDDMLTGASGDDTLNGDDGADTLIGNSGHDTLNGGDGNDTLNGDGGDDIIDGGDGDDTINGGVGEDTINGGNGNDTIFGNNQNDMLYGDAGDDVINGGGGNDTIDGGAGHDTLIGGATQDNMVGGDGNDTLRGDSGGDDLFGGAGADIIFGDGGTDQLFGGAGADVFQQDQAFGAADRIKDFEDGIDLIDFSANSLANDINDVLAAATQVGANIRVELNANNTMIIENFNLADLDASDFIFTAPQSQQAFVPDVQVSYDNALLFEDVMQNEITRFQFLEETDGSYAIA